MGRRRFTAVSVTGDIDDLIGLNDIGQDHTHTADIFIGTQQIGTTNLRLQEQSATTWEIRNILDTLYRHLMLQILHPRYISGEGHADDVTIMSDEQAAKGVYITSHDGSNWWEVFKGLAGFSRIRLKDKAGPAVAGDFDWDPAGGTGCEWGVYDRTNNRIYFYANGGVHHIQCDA